MEEIKNILLSRIIIIRFTTKSYIFINLITYGILIL